ncbi:MAG: hypothetical protein JNK29_19795 [Anaerolineales bacterium]|nr:hypothetical protein [Anaerolineales bacterium]
MDSPTAAALDHLNALLPLAERQAQLSPAERAAHQAILHAFAGRGRPPLRAELAAAAEVLARLSAADLVVLDPAGEIAGAYPFTLEATPHVVALDGHAVHAMCAVDALAIGAMFNTAAAITSACAATGAAVRVAQRGRTLLAAQPADLRVGIHWQPPGGCAAHSLCREMPFLRGAAAAEAWRAQAPAERETLTLGQALDLAAAFFAPLVQPAPAGPRA